MQFFRSTLILLLLAAAAPGQKHSPLAPKPQWSSLEKFQRTITEEDFRYLLTEIYAPRGASEKYFKLEENYVLVETAPGRPAFRLDFAEDRADAEPIPRYWSKKDSLKGLKLAIDPGHLGGEWAKMEERWFQIGKNKPVAEGDMTLLTARRLKKELERRGAKVSLLRHNDKPATSLRPEKLKKAAAASLRQRGRTVNSTRLRLESNRLFYRTAEIRARAKNVNKKIQPDLVLALHFNAEGWGNPARPSLVKSNHLHLLVSGCYSAEELSYEDQRHNLMVKLLNRSFAEEIDISQDIARAMAQATGLPPFDYRANPAAIAVGNSPYIWARNLLANRLFECPVIYLEPYVMNSHEVHQRLQAGDYRGSRKFNGISRKNIYREYVDGVVDGLVSYYGKN